MDEAEWLACTDAEKILAFLPGKVSDRKLRLYAVACCRRIWGLMTDERCRRAVEVAEGNADGVAGPEALESARMTAKAAWEVGRVAWAAARAAGEPAQEATALTLGAVAEAAEAAADEKASEAAGLAANQAAWATQWAAASESPDAWVMKAEGRPQSALLRDIFGNPFRPVTPDPACRTPTVISLATAAYEERDLPSGHLNTIRLAVLADALEEVGADHDLMAHLRAPGPHVRGCWAVDLVLAKE
jgi:hypothetical protein